MSFFESKRGTLYPIADIESMAEAREQQGGGRSHATVYLKDRGEFDGRIEVHDETIEQIKTFGRPSFAALPGYFLLQYCPDTSDGVEPFVWSQPVIGWQINEWGTLAPLVFETDFPGFGDHHGVLYPTGQVADMYGATYDTREGWEESQRHRAETDRQRKAEAAAAGPASGNTM